MFDSPESDSKSRSTVTGPELLCPFDTSGGRSDQRRNQKTVVSGEMQMRRIVAGGDAD